MGMFYGRRVALTACALQFMLINNALSVIRRALARRVVLYGDDRALNSRHGGSSIAGLARRIVYRIPCVVLAKSQLRRNDLGEDLDEVMLARRVIKLARRDAIDFGQ